MSAVARQAERSSLHPYNRTCLVLNADFRPLATYPLSVRSVRKVIENLHKGKVDVVEEWGGAFRSPSVSYPIPKVVALREFAPVYGEPKFCRRSVFLRDRFACQYCGKRFESADLTFDHLIPKSRGGTTIWENVVTCCIPCNALKADRPANHSGRRGVTGSLRPLKEPRRPSTAELLRAGLEFLSNDVREDFGSWLYWHTPLQA